MMSRSASDWDVLVTEYKALKKQVKSKQQAIQVLQQQLQLYQQRCSQYEKQLQRYEGKTPSAPVCRHAKSSESAQNQQTGKQGKIQSPTKMVATLVDKHSSSGSIGLAKKGEHMGMFPVFDQGQSLQEQFAELKALYRQAMDDNKLLRSRVGELQSHGGSSQSFHNVLAEKEQALQERSNLLHQLEQVKREAADMHIDLETCQEEKAELARERDFFREKSERLNADLLQKITCHTDHGASPMLDIDAMIVENRYLKERLARCMEEKQELLNLSVKQAKHRRGPKLPLSATLTRDDSSLEAGVSSKQLRKIHTLRATIGDLQALTQTLSDSLKDKNLALQHLRHINKTLAAKLLAAERELGKGSPSGDTLTTVAVGDFPHEEAASSTVPSLLMTLTEFPTPSNSAAKHDPTWTIQSRSNLSAMEKHAPSEFLDEDLPEEIIWQHPNLCISKSSIQQNGRSVTEKSHLMASEVKGYASCHGSTNSSLLAQTADFSLTEDTDEQGKVSATSCTDVTDLVDADVVTSSADKLSETAEDHASPDSAAGISSSPEADFDRQSLAESLRHVRVSDLAASEDDSSTEQSKLLQM